MIFTDAKDLRLGSVSAVAILASPTQYTVWGSGYITLTQPIVGATSFAKYGASVLTISGVNTYSGDTYIHGSTVFVGLSTAFGTGNINLSSCSFTNMNSITLNNGISAMGTILVDISGRGNFTFNGNMSGAGNIISRNTGTVPLYHGFSGDNSQFTGTYTQYSDTNIRTNFNSPSAGSENAAWRFYRTGTASVAINFANATLQFGSLSGGGSIRANIAGNTTLEVGHLNTDTVFSGILQQGASTAVLSLKKVGTGTLTLTNASTNVGNTNITNGTLSAAGAAIKTNNTGSNLKSAAFTQSTATFYFNAVPAATDKFVIFGGPTTNTYSGSNIVLVGATGRSGPVYTSSTSTLTFTA